MSRYNEISQELMQSYADVLELLQKGSRLQDLPPEWIQAIIILRNAKQCAEEKFAELHEANRKIMEYQQSCLTESNHCTKKH